MTTSKCLCIFVFCFSALAWRRVAQRVAVWDPVVISASIQCIPHPPSRRQRTFLPKMKIRRVGVSVTTGFNVKISLAERAEFLSCWRGVCHGWHSFARRQSVPVLCTRGSRCPVLTLAFQMHLLACHWPQWSHGYAELQGGRKIQSCQMLGRRLGSTGNRTSDCHSQSAVSRRAGRGHDCQCPRYFRSPGVKLRGEWRRGSFRARVWRPAFLLKAATSEARVLNRGRA